MKNLTKEQIEKNIASQPYKLVIDNPYGEGRIDVAHGSYVDMRMIKSVTKSSSNPEIVIVAQATSTLPQ